jgi:glycosyltransferase involved in cell wall biosynthesis
MAGVFRGQEEMARAFSDLDVIVVPSLWYENSPTVILEAFAHRIPVIATNLGGMAELVDHEINGLLFHLGDVNDLARQIHRLLKEPGLLPRLQDGIGPVKTVSQQIDEFEELFMRALTEKRRQKVAA